MLYAGCSYKNMGKWHSEMEGKTWTWFDCIRADWGQTSVTTLDACEPRYASVCLHVRVRVWDFHITLPSRLLVWPGKLSFKVSLVFQCLSALRGAGVMDACWETCPGNLPVLPSSCKCAWNTKHETSGANFSDYSHWLQQKHIRYPTTKEMRSTSGKQHQKRQGVSLLIFKMPTTLLHLSDLRTFTQGSMLPGSSNDSPQQQQKFNICCRSADRPTSRKRWTSQTCNKTSAFNPHQTSTSLFFFKLLRFFVQSKK